MKPCRNSSCRLSGTGSRANGAQPADHVNRYSHPIRTKTAARPTAEQLLEDISDRLSRQEELLAELLRRTEEKDTM